MGYLVYILYSEKLGKYYVGSAADLDMRLHEHNSGWSRFTRTGIPWKVIKVIEVPDRTAALKLENKIKKRGIKRYLQEAA
ncbi:MAG: GIY-YIG nuclease family protein [Bacteroidota bacterium]